jgi:uncharacterized repeat protein (TIGR03803 family)
MARHKVGATEVTQPELTTLVNFNGTDGAQPVAGLIADAYGDLFGTTQLGGANHDVTVLGDGTVFEITKSAHGYASTLTTLLSFNGTDGSQPVGSLIADAHGDLFGTMAAGGLFIAPGGVNGNGTVFEITESAHGYASTPTTLLSFNGTDGAFPTSSLIADAHGDLFGTTAGGGLFPGPPGTGDGFGTVFEITKTAHGYASTPNTLVFFNGTNGSAPRGSLIADAHGDLFGTTSQGGAYGDGTVFEIVKTAHGYAGTPTTLVSFNGANGAGPSGSLIADAHGDLFGTTQLGGANDLGTVFEIAKTAHGYASSPTTLVSFNGTDGAVPISSLIADAHGDLFGTTATGGLGFRPPLPGSGVRGFGTVFEIVKTAHGYASTPTTLVSFNGANGAGPFGNLIADSQGDLFGTTNGGGANNHGTVFEITGSGFSTHRSQDYSVVESHDSFVFDPKLGENTSVHSNAHDEAFEHPKSEFADFVALLAQAHGDGAHQTAHDATRIMDHAATLAAQHAHHFLV